MSARIQMIRMVRVAARDLRLSDEDRRALQLRVTGVESLADMTEAQIDKVVAEMKRQGFRPKGARPSAERADTRFAHKLWGLLHAKGAVTVKGAAGLNAFIRERFATAWGAAPIDVDRMQDASQIAAVIEALKAMCRRAGVEVDGRVRR